jgi:hypothetical protein
MVGYIIAEMAELRYFSIVCCFVKLINLGAATGGSTNNAE